MTEITIRPCEGLERDAMADRIDVELRATLARINIQSTNQAMVLVAETPTNELAGGLLATTAYGWLHLEALWVDDAFQRMGIGARLLAAVEKAARNHACHAIWLDTSNRDALRFYSRFGFEEFGRLNNRPDQFPPDHQRWFLSKSL